MHSLVAFLAVYYKTIRNCPEHSCRKAYLCFFCLFQLLNFQPKPTKLLQRLSNVCKMSSTASLWQQADQQLPWMQQA